MIGRSPKLQMNLVLLDGGVDIHVEPGFDLIGIDESNRAGLNFVSGAPKHQIAAGDVDPSQQDRIRCGSLSAEIRVALQTQLAAGQIQVAGGLYRYIEAQALQK